MTIRPPPPQVQKMALVSLCDGWRKMLIKQHLAPTVTKRAQGILCNPLVPKFKVWYQTPANLVPKSLTHGAKVGSLVPNYCKLGTKNFATWCQKKQNQVVFRTPQVVTNTTATHVCRRNWRSTNLLCQLSTKLLWSCTFPCRRIG